MRLTKKKALGICKELWQWIYKEVKGGNNWHVIYLKSVWTKWGEYGDMNNNCPCCHYAEVTYAGAKCKKCPLIKLWPGGCTSDGSPYTSVKSAEGKKRLPYIKEIIDACTEGLQ